MLYLLVREEAAPGGGVLDAGLTRKGEAKARELAAILKTLDIKAVHCAPTRRALDTVYPYIKHCKDHQDYILVQVFHPLAGPVYDATSVPRSFPPEEQQRYYARDRFFGEMPGIESPAAFECRVRKWFEAFYEDFNQTLAAEAVVADASVIAILFKMLVKDKALLARLNESLEPGAMFCFQPENFGIAFTDRIR